MTLPSEQFWRRVLLMAVGGVTAVVMLKIWENKETVLREIRRQFDALNEARQPEEHDERLG